jgi:hypothetical protein
MGGENIGIWRVVRRMLELGKSDCGNWLVERAFTLRLLCLPIMGIVLDTIYLLIFK